MPHIPGHQNNIPGVYKPSYGAGKALDAGIELENEPYVPINTQSLLELFQLGFTKETLSDFMGKNINDKSVTEAYNTIIGTLQKGDAPGGLVAYHFPETVLGDIENKQINGKSIKSATGGEYVNALSYLLHNIKQNPPLTPVQVEKGDGTRTFSFEIGNEKERKQLNDWQKKIQDLQEMRSTVPDTFNIYANPYEWSKDKWLDKGILNALLHEPLHSYFDHDESTEKGFSQEEYHNLTDKMKSNILDTMSEEELSNTLYNLLYK